MVFDRNALESSKQWNMGTHGQLEEPRAQSSDEAILDQLWDLQIIGMSGFLCPSCMTTLKKPIGNNIPAVTLKCVGASMREKTQLTKNLPATTSVNKMCVCGVQT